MSRAGAALAAALFAASPAAAHHVGAWSPRDNEISANFKQLKFAMQERKFEVAEQLYLRGQVRKELAKRAGALPPGLDDTVRAALRAGDAREVERGLTLVLVLLMRDLTLEAERQVAQTAAPRSRRAAAGERFLEAIWRYYNLVDFTVTQRDPKAATGIRLAFDDAEGSTRGTAQDGQAKPASPSESDPDKMLEPLRRIARILSGVIETLATSTRRDS